MAKNHERSFSFVIPKGNKAIAIVAPTHARKEDNLKIEPNPPTPPSSRGASSTASSALSSALIKTFTPPRYDGGNERDDWAFDVYARPFVPYALTIINSQPGPIIDTESNREINFSSYISNFAGTAFLPKRPPITSHDQNLGISMSPSSLTEYNYERYFQHHLSVEIRAKENENENYALYKVLLGIADNAQGICNLHVPGLREDSPMVEIGDTIQLRQLRLDRNGNLLGMDLWLGPGGGASRELPCPAWTGYQFNASVWGINRASEQVYLRVHGLRPESMIFNVVFQVQQRRVQAMRTSLAMIQEYFREASRSAINTRIEIMSHELLCHEAANSIMSNGHGQAQAMQQSELGKDTVSGHSRQHPWIRGMLFPTESDGELQRTLHKIAHTRNLFDARLNFEQLKAVDTICRNEYGILPFLISGPPGTGKTKTLVETALQLLTTTKVSHILVCAPSDPAADTLALRLREHLKPRELLRLNGPSRTFQEVPGNLLSHCHVEDDTFILPPMSTLMQYEIVVTTCRDAALLVSARVTNNDLYSLETGLLSALHPNSSTGTKRDLHWGALLIDEAAQAIEPEAIIPITVVAPPVSAKVIQPQFVMAGDHKQLGPRTASKNTAIGTSLFERLFNRPIYSDHPLARNKAKPSSTPRVLTEAMLPIIRAPFSNLIRNYRSHPAILTVPSSLFYHDTLIPEATDTSSLLSWPGWQGRRWPVLFACNSGLDEIERDGGGWYNKIEARMACDYALSLFKSGLVAQKDICVMSPFSAQVKLLRSMIRAAPYQLWEVNIGPMEAFQGLESRAVILCTTRTRTRFLDSDASRGLGIVNQPKRMNVALTRAKHGLIVIGSPTVLATDSNWTAFLAFCRRNRLWQDQAGTGGVTFGDDIDELLKNAGKIGGLEKALVMKEEGRVHPGPVLGGRRVDVEEDMWVAGMQAALMVEDTGYGDENGDDEEEAEAEEQEEEEEEES
ncbi:P-loop containing nucleoside triphosphate hydrolase protein [Lepidopterella palustris CBS 459.81]|uniref:P-loop containing nucleoside triphosphate hydrolase protein n=1 Tax=Lepidopterella palustris CBS 459.81 TaxID=1314670 RepID=A0A8E2DY16_9PEZI|nr:P-loop containing nucleoside triphosphate hydrolase protein [Lepidopterella palustris CBS 459.81]